MIKIKYIQCREEEAFIIPEFRLHTIYCYTRLILIQFQYNISNNTPVLTLQR